MTNLKKWIEERREELDNMWEHNTGNATVNGLILDLRHAITIIEKQQALLEKARDALTKFENDADDLNADYGNNAALCVFCFSNKYNERVGIIHKDSCAILMARAVLKNMEGK